MDKVREILKAILLVCIALNVSSLAAQGAQVKTLFSIKNNKTIAPECYSDILHDKLMATDVKYKERHEAMEKSIQASLDNPTWDKNSILTVPVVVHVVHIGEPVGVGSNISDEQVYSAIAALNEDYRKMSGTNGDGNGVDSEIEFCLAVRDPNDNPTSGINRVDGTSVPNYATQGIRLNSTGASEVAIKALSLWPRADYYNIWVVNEIEDNNGGSGIQGYAYFPASSPQVDGTVILHNAFGTVGNLKGYTNMNRTTTHELGHGLNLYHTFRGGSCTESNCATDGDKVCDTPPTTNTGSCNTPACSGTQQVENYMDYTSQNCKNMYTQGQRDRMRAALTGIRGSLLQSAGCTPVNNLDVGVDQVLSPIGNTCDEMVTPVISVRNFGSVAVSSMAIGYSIDGGTQSTFNYTGNLTPANTVDIELPAISTSQGSHNLNVNISAANGQTDDFLSNNSGTSSFTVATGTTITVLVQQDTYGGDTTWELFDDAGNLLLSGGPYNSGETGTVHTESICVPLSCYSFSIHDDYGDGLIGSAYYEVTDTELGVIATGSDFGNIETTNFCTDEGGTGGGETPVADFTSNMTTACVGELINFSDQSTESPTSWSWTFEGANNPLSSNQHPTGISYDTPGVYDVTLVVTNGNGSSMETKTNYITIGGGPVVNGNTVDLSCNGSNDGSIDLIVSANGPSYSWSNGATTQDLSGLSAGTYSVLVTDVNGCETMKFYTVEEPSAIVISLNSITPDVDNTGVGSASVNITGGVQPYLISWSNGGTGLEIQNVNAGAYVISVTDSNGCSVSLTVNVSNNDSNSSSPPIADFVVTSESICAQSTVNFTDMSINSPSSWTWDFPGGIPSTSSSMNPTGIRYDTPGTYDVSLTVTNAHGTDTKMNMNYVHTMESPELSTSTTNISCFGMSDGSIDLGVTGGSTEHTYSWSNGSSTEDVSGLSAGSYNVTVTNTAGCSTSTSFNIVEPGPILMSVLGVQPDSCDLGIGQVNVVPSGGTPDYTILWNDPLAQTEFSLTNLNVGTYVGIVTDANNCTQGTTVNIEEVDCEAVGIEEDFGSELIIYPNPFDGVSFNLDYISGENVAIQLFDITGSMISTQVNKLGLNKYAISINNELSNGLYMVRITDGQKSIVKKMIVKH